MTPHTPGPWIVDEPVIMSEDNGYTICRIGDGETEEFQDVPNARLIAAAPELLEALKELSIAHSPMNGCEPENKYLARQEAAYKKAEQAIARAEGRQP